MYDYIVEANVNKKLVDQNVFVTLFFEIIV
jgi:hypothetical protein